MPIPFVHNKKAVNQGEVQNSANGNGKKWWQHRLGIRQHLTLLILLLLLPLLVIQGYSAYQEYQTQRQATLENQAATARSVARTVNAFINDQINNNRAVGYILRNLSNPTVEQGNAALAEFRQSLSYLVDYRFLNPDGRVRFADPAVLVGSDMSQSDAFKQLVAGSDSAVTNLRLSDVDQKTPVFGVMSKVYNANQLVGVVVGMIDTTQLNQILNIKLGNYGRGSISIHDKKANLIYNSQFPNLPYENRSNRSTPSVLAALQGRETLQDYVKSALDGVEKMGASTPISSFGWSASVAEPIEDAMAPTNNIIYPRLIGFSLVALLAVVAGWFYSRYLARPLVDLRQAAYEFGQGKLQRRAVTTQHYVGEVEQLSQSFNQMADKIAQETKARDAFLAQAAHELRTPMTVIKGTNQYLLSRLKKALNKPPTPDERQNVVTQLEKMEHQVNRMNELISRLLELTRLQNGRMEYQFEPVNFPQLVERCVEAARQLTTADRHPITLSLLPGNSTPSDWLVQADSARIEQVVLNLLENAIKYSPNGGPIAVSLRFCEAGDRLEVPGLELSVKDSGLGIAQADLEHLFERYYRAQAVGSKIGGLGLGLYISHEIVRQHGGRLWPTSSGPDEGSSFYLVLPSQQTATVSENKDLTPSLPLSGDKPGL